ncbi:MAG: [Abditibacteriota bacterium]|nr:[FeFe] hydrogenase H-cluster maturation GTPase HydF [Abditibacteriota bacterium]
MKDTPVSERIRIAFAGRRNAGKSSLINAFTSQEVSIVSDVPGTTTDPVSKTMELFPLGPVVITDTAGLDDTGVLGELRTAKTEGIIDRSDMVFVVISSEFSDLSLEKELMARLRKAGTDHIVCMTKSDLGPGREALLEKELETRVFPVSSTEGTGIEELRIYAGKMRSEGSKPRTILEGLCSPGSKVLMITPIDESAPKGRMILPQVMTLRDSMDRHCICACVQPQEYPEALEIFRPDLCITDSQAFAFVDQATPESLRLTSFSILMARAKGDLSLFYEGAQAIDSLTDHSRILIAEACTHHVQKNDIGTGLIPDKLRKYTGKSLVFEKSSGADFPSDLSDYDLVIHCGGCMISARDMRLRQNKARDRGVPMTNYGVLLAKLGGILERAAGWLL